MSESKAPLEVQADRERKILFVWMRGDWSTQITDELRRQFDEAVDSFAGTPFDVVADMTESLTQKAEGAERLKEMMGYAAAHGLARSARIVKSSMVKLQAQRLSTESHVESSGFFSSRDQALAWLKK